MFLLQITIPKKSFSSNVSEITLTIEGSGKQQILSNSFNILPMKIVSDCKWMENKKFVECIKKENIVKFFFGSQINSTEKMFINLTNIKSIDLSKFDSSKITNMNEMFRNCNKLEYINLNNFNTSSVINMNGTFRACESLKSLNLSGFVTNKVIYMYNMFFQCKTLTSLNLSNFNTSSVEYMGSMFTGCNSLQLLDLTNFNTSKVIQMRYMFSNCKKLVSLDLSHFNTSSVKYMEYMFNGCTSLIYLNIYLFSKKSNTNITKTFNNINSNVKYCIKEPNQFSISSDCENICFKNNTKIIIEKNKCIENCSDDDEYIYEYNKICYNKCPNNTYDSPINKYSCKESHLLKNEKIEGYYFDEINGGFKKCFKSCKYCYGFGNETNNNCLECNSGYEILNDFINDSNCYSHCEHYYYFDSSHKYFCTETKKCPDNLSKLLIDKNRCIDDCKKVNKYEYNNYCYDYVPLETEILKNSNISIEIASEISQYIINATDEEIISKDKLLLRFQNDIINHKLDSLLLNITENHEDFIYKEDDVIYQITTTENQKNNKNNNNSIIDLGKCEEILKEKYKINDKLTLIILKIDYNSPELLIPIVGYEVYHPIYKYKLNLSYCDNSPIKINLPVVIDEDNLFIYEPNSSYYNDYCNAFTTENGTDILLIDRQQEYNDKNLSLCQKECTYLNYNSTQKKSVCQCEIKNKMNLISEIMSDPDKLSTLPISNETSTSSSLNSIKCTKNLFTKEGLKNNISSYILLLIIFIFLLSIILFMKCGYPLLENDINEIIRFKQKELKIKKSAIDLIKHENKKNKKQKKNSFRKRTTNFQFPPKKRSLNLMGPNDLSNRNNYNKGNNINNKNYSGSRLKIKGGTTSNELNLNMNLKINKNNKYLKTNSKEVNKNKEMKFTDFEINYFSYKKALNFDKRNYCEYYKSLLRMKHPIIFSFAPIKDYNTFIIKVNLFFFSFSIYYAVNLLFFTNEIIHQIYETGGDYEIKYFITKIIYSFIIAHFISNLIKFIFLSERNILKIKEITTLDQLYNTTEKVKRTLVIKYTIFFILGIIFLVFFWMFLSSFGAV